MRRFHKLTRYLYATIFCLSSLLLFSSCDIVPYLHMRDQPKYEPYEESVFFEDGQSSRPVVANTIARGNLRIDTHYYEGKVDGIYVDSFPFEITLEVVERGQERYNIYCAPCHGQVGDGLGMIVQRGLKKPSSFHIPRLRDESVGYYYDVISNGFGSMYSYASRVPPEDRWAIIAYIRALQYSQNPNMDDFNEEGLSLLEERQETELDVSEEGDDHE